MPAIDLTAARDKNIHREEIMIRIR